MDPGPSRTKATGSKSGDSFSDRFHRHQDSVLCCAIDKKNKLAVSGGVDDTAFVWDIKTKHIVFECSGHKESVVAVGFSLCSTYVATGDLNGYIQVRNTITGIKLFDYELDEINWLVWHNTSDFVLIAGTSKGDFWMWNVVDPDAIKSFPSFGCSVTAAKLLVDGRKIITTYADGSVRCFDLKTQEIITQLIDQSSESEVICVDVNRNETLIAIGCMNAIVKLITIHTFRVIATFNGKTPDEFRQNLMESDSEGPETTQAETNQADEEDADEEDADQDIVTIEHIGAIEVIDCDEVADNVDVKTDGDAKENASNLKDGNTGDGQNDSDHIEIDDDDYSKASEFKDPIGDTDSIESVLFSPCGNYVSAANMSGSIFIWDISTQATRAETHTGIGITRCAWVDKGHLVTGSLDGYVRLYDSNLKLIVEKQQHSDQILDLACSKNLIMTASEDKSCRTMSIAHQ